MTAKRVLFFAEAVTLAHVARPIVLARGLAAANYEPYIACDSRYRRFIEREPWPNLPLHSISSERFLRSLANGSPVYDVQTLRDYVAEDLKLIHSVKPDLIVGDFRLSLSVSARLAGIPYAAITNAYWSPYYVRKSFPLPVLPITRVLPLPVAGVLFQLARPLAFKLHCAPLNRLRRESGLAQLGDDLRRIYTDADFTLYADAPSMFPTENLPTNHQYLGPVIWSPPVDLPSWWNDLPSDRPIVYVTLGSSGEPSISRLVLDALAEMPLTVLASTAGAPLMAQYPPNVFVANYLPGVDVAARSQLVVCNGGSPTSQQALAAGVPVLGIASNMDQFLNMQAITEANAGSVVRADRVRRASVCKIAEMLLSSAACRTAAADLAASHQPTVVLRFRAFVDATTVQPTAEPRR